MNFHPPYITPGQSWVLATSTTSEITITGAFFTTDTLVEIPNVTIDSITAVSDVELLVEVTTGAGEYSNLDLTINNGRHSTLADAVDITSALYPLPSSYDLTNKGFWYHAGELGSITTAGTGVSEIKDKFDLENGNHATQTADASRPSTGTQTVNGVNAIDFDTGDYMDTGVQLEDQGTLIVVFRMTETPTEVCPVGGVYETGGSGDKFGATYADDANNTARVYKRDDGLTANDFEGKIVQPRSYISAFSWDGATVNLAFWDDAGWRTNAQGALTIPSTAYTILLGGAVNENDTRISTWAFGGYLMEVVYYSEAKTYAEVDAIMTDMQTTWNVPATPELED